MSGRSTGFFWHERCFWHDLGPIGVFAASGEFLQPQPASESPESKRRLKNLLEVSGLIDELEVRKAPPASREDLARFQDRKSTRLNSSHVSISYAVFCLKKK